MVVHEAIDLYVTSWDVSKEFQKSCLNFRNHFYLQTQQISLIRLGVTIENYPGMLKSASSFTAPSNTKKKDNEASEVNETEARRIAFN